jgi:hypothetical protein
MSNPINNFKRPKTYIMNDEMDIITEDGNRKPGDRAIWFVFKKTGFKYKPRLKELFYWIQLKSKVEENNYPQSEGKQGRKFLQSFLNAAINNVSWEKASKIFKLNK